jgi:pullulanase
MRNVHRALVLVAVLLTTLCAPRALATLQARDFPSLAPKLKVRDYAVDSRPAESLLVVHYHRSAKDYAGWNLWVWPEGGDGTQSNFDGEDAFGRYAIIPFETTPARVGFLIRRGNWEEKDFDQDRFVALKKGEVTEIWVTSGEGGFTTDPTKVDLSLRVEGAFLDDDRTITFATSRPLERDEVRALRVVDRRNPSRVLRIRDIDGGKLTRIILARPVPTEDVGRLEIRFDPAVAAARELAARDSITVYARDVLVAPEFTPLSPRIGAFCSPTATHFSTWSPVSESVELLLYDSLTAPSPARVVPLTRGDRGLWTVEVEGDLHGVPYRYRFTNYGVGREVPDMWGFAANSDSSRTVVADLSRLRPDGFDATVPPKLAQPTDEIIYEIHVRDFTQRCPNVANNVRGTYLGLVHSGIPSGNNPTTGLAHLKELGVTAIHLLPVHDFTAKVGEYNWGYWTTLFNVPESNYATNPEDPFSAIRDLRSAVTTLHQHDIRVILDVVYNHTSDGSLFSPFGAAVPYYFFRTTPAGRLTNDSGTGNGFADERPMARKYIVDSVAHWLEEYKIDGFRFDLLGCHKPETVRAICERVKAIRPDATLYGEPWTGGGPIHFGKGAQKGLPIAVFNDHLRNAIRGDLDGTAIGFATGVGGDIDAIRRGIKGAIDDFTLEPTETINYASAHDNLVLWDKIAKTQPTVADRTRRMMQKLAIGVVLTSQGIPFLHGGCEFARTKQGNHNSYNAGDEINDFGWSRKAEYADIYEYTKGLIELRRAHPAFRMADDADVRKAILFEPSRRDVAFTIDGRVAGDSWSRIYVAYNDEPTPLDVTLPQGEWTIVVDATRAGTTPLGTARGTVTLPPYSMFVAHRD